MLKDVFGFAECQENATYGLGYELTRTRNKVEAVIYKSGGVAELKSIIFFGMYLIILHLCHNKL